MPVDLTTRFKDGAQIKPWFRDDVEIAVEAGSFHGDDQGFFHPEELVDRQTLAAVEGRQIRRFGLLADIALQATMRQVANGVVEIRTNRGLGAGMIVSKAGHILTAKHVIDGATSISVGWSSPFADHNTYLPPSVGMPTSLKIATEAPGDLALLNPAWDRVFEPVRFSSRWDEDSEIQVADFGKSLLAQGSPLGMTGWCSRVMANGLRTVNGQQYLGLSGPINPGNSGGPVFEESGATVGLVDLKMVDVAIDAVAFAIPLPVILRFLRANGIEPVMA